MRDLTELPMLRKKWQLLNMKFMHLTSETEIVEVAFKKSSTFTGKSLSETLLFAENGEDMLCTKNVLNVRNNFCTQHVLPRFELGIFLY